MAPVLTLAAFGLSLCAPHGLVPGRPEVRLPLVRCLRTPRPHAPSPDVMCSGLAFDCALSPDTTGGDGGDTALVATPPATHFPCQHHRGRHLTTYSTHRPRRAAGCKSSSATTTGSRLDARPFRGYRHTPSFRRRVSGRMVTFFYSFCRYAFVVMCSHYYLFSRPERERGEGGVDGR